MWLCHLILPALHMQQPRSDSGYWTYVLQSLWMSVEAVASEMMLRVLFCDGVSLVTRGECLSPWRWAVIVAYCSISWAAHSHHATMQIGNKGSCFFTQSRVWHVSKLIEEGVILQWKLRAWRTGPSHAGSMCEVRKCFTQSFVRCNCSLNNGQSLFQSKFTPCCLRRAEIYMYIHIKLLWFRRSN